MSRKFIPVPRWIFPALIAAVFLAACGRMFEDNATHLAYALEKAADKLRASTANESVVHLAPLDGIGDSYYVEVTPSFGEQGNESGPWGSYLVVSGKTPGGTSYHNRFVFVPRRLYVKKDGGATELVLRKDGDRISLVEVR